MSRDDESATRPSLLMSIRNPREAAAWESFATKYRPKIVAWCCQYGLQTSDAEDVAQIVLLKVMNAIRTYEYDPSLKFRGWLRTVCKNAVTDLTRKSIPTPASDSPALSALDDRHASSGMVTRLIDSLEAELDRELWDEACRRVRQRIAPRTWAIFENLTQDMTGKEVAEMYAMSVASVYQAKHRVTQLLRAEISRQLGLEMQGVPE